MAGSDWGKANMAAVVLTHTQTAAPAVRSVRWSLGSGRGEVIAEKEHDYSQKQWSTGHKITREQRIMHSVILMPKYCGRIRTQAGVE